MGIIVTLMMTIQPILVYASSENVNSGVEVQDKETVKGVQGVLNYFGYNCGTPDGTVGPQTENAVRAYQRDQGLTETGKITQEVIDRVLSGIPLTTFNERFNEAIDYWNGQREKTRASIMNEFDFDEETERYCPNGNLTIYLNPNLQSRKMVGNINIVSEGDFDTDLTMVEISATLYAFNISMEKPDDALNLITNIFEAEGDYLEDGITFKNYSFKGMIAIIATYDSFSGTSISNDYTKDKENRSEKDDKEDKKEEYDDRHFETDIEDEPVVDMFDITDIEKIEMVADLVDSTADVVAEKAGIIFDDDHYYEKNESMNYYHFNCNIGKYNGKISFSIEKSTDKIALISLDISDDKEPIAREDVLAELNKLIGKSPYKSYDSEIGWTTDVWKIGKCDMDMLSYPLTEDQYPGVRYIHFVKKN